MLDGVRPRRPPVILKRVVMSVAPLMEPASVSKAVGLVVSDESSPPTFEPMSTATVSSTNGKAKNDDNSNLTGGNESSVNMMGCAPYLQIFKGGRLLFTTCTTTGNNRGSTDDIPWCVSGTGGSQQRCFTFAVDAVIQGDILLRCRHMTNAGQRVSMFRIALHSGYIVAPEVLRLSKSDIDGACHDDRFPEDFYLDLVFDVCDADTAGKLLVDDGETDSSHVTKEGFLKTSESEAEVKEKAETSAPKSLKPSVITPTSAYDSMLFGDSRLWDSIAKRQGRISAASRVSEKKGEKLVGPTIGRKRDLSKLKLRHESENNDSKSPNRKVKKSPAPMDSFSIGDNFGFMESEEPNEVATPKPPRKPDKLMEALMAIEHGSPETQKHKASADKGDDTRPEIEEIVFHRGNHTDTSVQGTQDSNSGNIDGNGNCSQGNKDEELEVLPVADEVNEEDINIDDVDGDIEDFDFDQLGGDLDLEDDDDKSLDDLEEFLTRA